jgi:hypothetical protein
MKKNLVILSLLIFITPSIVLASWWNPLSWTIFNFFNKTQQIDIPKIENSTSSVSTKNIEDIKNGYVENEKKIDNSYKEKVSAESRPSVNSVNPNNPKGLLIANFLKNPTIENFKVFCESAKTIEGNSTKQILDQNRENLINIKVTLYEEIKDCQKISTNTDNTYYLPLDKNLLISLANDDTDEIRRIKILYNAKINNFISTSKLKFIGFKGTEKSHSPNELFQAYIEDVHKSQSRLAELNQLGDKISKEIAETSVSLLMGRISEITNSVFDLSGYFK